MADLCFGSVQEGYCAVFFVSAVLWCFLSDHLFRVRAECSGSYATFCVVVFRTVFFYDIFCIIFVFYLQPSSVKKNATGSTGIVIIEII